MQIALYDIARPSVCPSSAGSTIRIQWAKMAIFNLYIRKTARKQYVVWSRLMYLSTLSSLRWFAAGAFIHTLLSRAYFCNS